MSIPEKIYYLDHAQRYAHLSPREREQLPDEVKFPSSPWIKRVKNMDEMTKEDWTEYGPDGIRYAAKDIRLCDAEVWH